MFGLFSSIPPPCRPLKCNADRVSHHPTAPSSLSLSLPPSISSSLSVLFQTNTTNTKQPRKNISVQTHHPPTRRHPNTLKNTAKTTQTTQNNTKQHRRWPHTRCWWTYLGGIRAKKVNDRHLQRQQWERKKLFVQSGSWLMPYLTAGKRLEK